MDRKVKSFASPGRRHSSSKIEMIPIQIDNMQKDEMSKRSDCLSFNQFSRFRSRIDCNQYAFDTFISFLFDEVTDDFVVKVGNRFPLDTFTAILVLFGSQCQLNEELLQFFVAIVDTELLKAVVFKDFETVNIENAHNHLLLLMCGLLRSFIKQ